MDGSRQTPELEAFAGEARGVEETLRQAAAAGADPSGPGLGDWTLGALVNHLVGVAGRLDRLADAGGEVPPGPPEVDRRSYYATAPAWSFEEAVVPPGEWVEQFSAAWQRSARTFERIGPGALLASPCGVITAREYLATRVLEVVVHHIDVRTALDHPPVTTPAAGRLTLRLLEGLLEGPRPRNFGRTRFILAATGRIHVDDPRFPVLG